MLNVESNPSEQRSAKFRSYSYKASKIKLHTHYYVIELANSDVLKVENKITSQSATCCHKIPLLTIYIDRTPLGLHIRNQYTEIRNKYY